MQSPLFDGVGSTHGTYRMLPPLQEAHYLKNSSHIQELYQNLPQLPKPFRLPVSYKSYEAQNNLVNPYSEQQRLGLSSPPSFLYSKLQPSNHNSKPRYPKHHSEQELEKDQQMMHKRNGWGWDAGNGHHGHQHKHGNTPALSALALLGFMFFLNLIQNSLQNNRQLLAAAALNATTVSVVAGRENPYGYRFKRGIKDENKYAMPSSLPSFMARDGYSNVGKTGQNKEKSSNNEYRVKFIPGSNSQNSSLSSSNNMEKDFLSAKLQQNPIEILKSSSVHCCQLVACKLGESIYDSLDKTTGFMIRMLGSTMITRIPRKTWTGRILRALDKGWKKESCDHLFRNCGALYKLLYNATNAGPVRRKRKH